MKEQYIPKILISTWVELATKPNFSDIQHMILPKINRVFGNINNAERYLNNIKPEEPNW